MADQYTDDDYKLWLEELKPFLVRGKSLGKSIALAGLNSKKDTIYRRWRLKDWFCEKIDSFAEELGEIINDIFYDSIVNIQTKVKAEKPLTSEEVKILTTAAERHRSAQRFFVNRQETASGKTVEEVLGELNNDAESGHDELAEFAEGQVVADDPSVQDQNQVGQDSNIQTQPNTVEAPSGNPTP